MGLRLPEVPTEIIEVAAAGEPPGPDHRILLPVAAVVGAILVLIADSLARTLVSPAELPVGLVMSLIGGPFFLWLLIKQRRVL